MPVLACADRPVQRAPHGAPPRHRPVGVAGGRHPRVTDRDGFPDGFFDRQDPSPDQHFYDVTRLVTHIDDDAIAAVGELYDELGIDGAVLDLMSSWVSHFRRPPGAPHGARHEPRRARGQPGRVRARRARPQRSTRRSRSTTSRSTRRCAACRSTTSCEPIEVFREVRRVLRPGGPFVCTFSNRLFPTKAIRGWLATDDRGALRDRRHLLPSIRRLDRPGRRAPDAHSPRQAIRSTRSTPGAGTEVPGGSRAYSAVMKPSTRFLLAGLSAAATTAERHPSRLAHRPGLHARLRLRAHPVGAAAPDRCGPARHGRAPRPLRRAARVARRRSASAAFAGVGRRAGRAPPRCPRRPARCSRRRWSTSSAADYRSRIREPFTPRARGAAHPPAAAAPGHADCAGATGRRATSATATPACATSSTCGSAPTCRPTPRRRCCSRSTAAPG